MNRTHREVGGQFGSQLKQTHGLRKRRPRAHPRVVINVAATPPKDAEERFGRFDAGDTLLRGASIFVGGREEAANDNRFLTGALHFASGNKKGGV